MSIAANCVRTWSFSPVTKFTANAIRHVGQEFNHGYVVGVNATWHMFDGFATKGRMLIATTGATRSRSQALEAVRRYRWLPKCGSAFLDLRTGRQRSRVGNEKRPDRR